MALVNFTIVASDMVWQWYHDELGGKHVREITGRDAMKFIDDLKMSIGENKVAMGSVKVVESNYPVEKDANEDVTNADEAPQE